MIFELLPLLEDSNAGWFVRSHTLEVLVAWQSKEAIPIIINAWQKGVLAQTQSLETLKSLTNENFSSPEAWQKWWVNKGKKYESEEKQK